MLIFKVSTVGFFLYPRLGLGSDSKILDSAQLGLKNFGLVPTLIADLTHTITQKKRKLNLQGKTTSHITCHISLDLQVQISSIVH